MSAALPGGRAAVPAPGTWPTWCAGVRVVPPFTAHAWIEAEGSLVGEGVPDGYFARLVTVEPSSR